MGHREVVEFLTRRGADVGARDKDGVTAAFRARENGHGQIVSFLLESDDEDDIMLVKVDAALSSTPVYAVPCRNNVARPCHNKSLCNEVIKGELGLTAAKWTDNGATATDISIKEPDRLGLFQKEELNGTRLRPNDRSKGSEFNYDLHEVTTSHLGGVETNELLSKSLSGSEAGEISGIPMHGYTRNNHGKYEKIDHSEGINSCPELGEKSNEFKQSKIENESNSRLELTPEDPSGFHKRTNFYEELPEDNCPQLEQVVEVQEVQSGTSCNEQKTNSMQDNASSYRKRNLTRTPTYEEIKLPGYNDSPLKEVSLNEDNATINPFSHSRIPNQINFPENVYSDPEFDEDDTIEELPQILNRKSKSKKFNDWTNNFGFRKRPHHYEEIKAPELAHVESQTEHFDNAVIESRVRSVLQAELGKLVPSICNRISQMDTANPASKPSPDFIREFFEVGNYSNDNNNNVHNIPDCLISFRHLHRLIREEMQAFAGDTYLVNISKEFSDECLESIDILHRSCSQSSVVSRCSQNDKISSVTNENSRIRSDVAVDTRRDEEGEEQVELISNQQLRLRRNENPRPKPK